ncbi:unnamed protein product [Miscanthus lutarioriparius]|uniref:Uncharacterized protein n=1 Tax=Miscanthus lutarioriparius TaxID=422564 RepID=A0A811RCK9_9POAL|nr:unnamed protein product [Miscanthus lutarioriparius]
MSSGAFRGTACGPGLIDPTVSRAVVAELSEMMDQSCWSQLPPELLREMLVRIEASKSWWPACKDVVSCAGVCQACRSIVKEAVRVSEVSGKLMFPISLKQIPLMQRMQGMFGNLVPYPFQGYVLQNRPCAFGFRKQRLKKRFFDTPQSYVAL